MVHIIDNRLCYTIKQYDTHSKMIHLIDNRLCNIKQYVTYLEMIHLIIIYLIGNKLINISNNIG